MTYTYVGSSYPEQLDELAPHTSASVPSQSDRRAALRAGMRALESRLYNVEASDPLALGGAAVVLLLVSVVASWLPARRAGRTDPIQILQAE